MCIVCSASGVSYILLVCSDSLFLPSDCCVWNSPCPCRCLYPHSVMVVSDTLLVCPVLSFYSWNVVLYSFLLLLTPFFISNDCCCLIFSCLPHSDLLELHDTPGDGNYTVCISLQKLSSELFIIINIFRHIQYIKWSLLCHPTLVFPSYLLIFTTPHLSVKENKRYKVN